MAQSRERIACAQGRACQLTRDLASMHGIEQDGESLPDSINSMAAVLVEHFCTDMEGEEL